MTVQVDCLWQARATLGECPVWDDSSDSIWWADILNGSLMVQSREGDRRERKFDGYVAAVALGPPGELILALPTGIHSYHINSDEIAFLSHPDAPRPGNRYNDGKCDARGNYWAGSMDWSCESTSGALYRLTPEGEVTLAIDGIAVTNGPAFSNGGQTLYHTDTMARRIDRHGLLDGLLLPPSTFAVFAEDDGYPDGMTVDADDHLWVAHCGGGCVSRWTPDGTEIARIELPVSGVTSCLFGGKALNELFVTTSTHLLDKTGLDREPLAGSLFRITGLEVSGVPAGRYGVRRRD